MACCFYKTWLWSAAIRFVISVAPFLFFFLFFSYKEATSSLHPCTLSHKPTRCTISVFYLIMKLCKWWESPADAFLFNSNRFRPPLAYFEISDLIRRTRRLRNLWREMRETKTFNGIHSPHKEVIKSRG